MNITKNDIRHIRTQEDIVYVRQSVREWANTIKLNLIDQTKIVTAASELARNTLEHGGGGLIILQIVSDGLRTGLKLTFEDKGKGIPDIDLALSDGYTSGGGMGLGLGGSRRLVNEFYIQSKPNEGTTVTVIKWK